MMCVIRQTIILIESLFSNKKKNMSSFCRHTSDAYYTTVRLLTFPLVSTGTARAAWTAMAAFVFFVVVHCYMRYMQAARAACTARTAARTASGGSIDFTSKEVQMNLWLTNKSALPILGLKLMKQILQL
jgi:hypothetical protein